MKICVFGAGSLGSAIGGILAQHNEVTLVGRKSNVCAVREKGLRLVGDIVRLVRLEAYEHTHGQSPPDLLIISTKSYDTQSAIRSCKRFSGKETMVLTLQNGLGNLELLRRWKGARAFGGTTTMGAALVSPGKVRISGTGLTVIGSDINPDGANVIGAAFGSCGLRVAVKRNITGEIWGKAVINACINPTTALLRVQNGRLLESRTTARFIREICRECEQVATASDVALPSRNMYPRVRAVCAHTSGNISSMLQDVQKGNRTEILQINGVFSSIGRARSIPTPLNDALVAMIEPLHLFSKGERLIS